MPVRHTVIRFLLALTLLPATKGCLQQVVVQATPISAADGNGRTPGESPADNRAGDCPDCAALGQYCDPETWTCANPETVDIQIQLGSDDAEERIGTGSVQVDRPELDLGETQEPQRVGMRFSNLAIPPNAPIVSSHIQFTVDEVTDGDTTLTFWCEAVDNAAPFADEMRNLSSRPITQASVIWIPPPWPTIDVADDQSRTPNLSSLIQEVIDRPGWASGSALVVLVDGTGERSARSYDHPANSGPLLDITFSNGTPNTIEQRVNGSTDDTEEFVVNGSMSMTSADLKLGADVKPMLAAFRFAGVDVPTGAQILSAHVQFQAKDANPGPCALIVRGEANGAPAGFQPVSHNISARPTTSAAVAWDPPDWLATGDADAAQRTPDLTPIIQEIVDQPGWMAPGPIVLIIRGTGERTAETVEGQPPGAARLHIEYIP